MAATTLLTFREQEKLTVITQAIKGEITNDQAAKTLRVSVRQVKRLKATVRKDGDQGVVHSLKGKAGNHRISARTKELVLPTIQKEYPDFKPSFATEKLAENHQVVICPETARLWMIEAGLWKVHRQKRKNYRAWRERKEYFGELEQFDGYYHYWLEDRDKDENGEPVEMCLLAAIDDATGKITKATLTMSEGVISVFAFWKEYGETTGKPAGIYLDKFSTYKINHKMAQDNTELTTQFGRAAKTLGINLITANSPEAKGRVERLFLTLQDRLVKEMRLAKICSPQKANQFLKEVFIPKFNQKFSVPARKEGDLHQELTKADRVDLNRTFSVQSTRRVNSDFTIQFKNQWYQLLEIQPVTIRPRETVLAEVWLDDSPHFSFKGKYLATQLLPIRPVSYQRQPVVLTTHKLNWKPPPDHPWRRDFRG